MKIIQGQTFTAATVVLDDCCFVDCKFTNCRLLYGGGDNNFVNCKLEDSGWLLYGAAEKTAMFLRNTGWTPPPGMQPLPFTVPPGRA